MTAQLGDRPLPGVQVWTDERIEAWLRVFLVGRSRWPYKREFREEGFGALCSAVCRYGGHGTWAVRLGFTPRGRGRPRS